MRPTDLRKDRRIDDDPERIRLRSGISVYGTENQARHKARDYPHLGRYIAVDAR